MAFNGTNILTRLVVILAWIGELSASHAVPPFPEGVLRAKAFNILEVSFPYGGDIKSISFEFSTDGETFLLGEVGLPRPERLFYSVAQKDETTKVLVPAVAGWTLGDARFLVEAATNLHIRWTIKLKDHDTEVVNIENTVPVLNQSQADLRFLAGLAEPELVRAMFGRDFFERQTGNAVEQYADPEQRALKVIGNLLSATREKWFEDKMRQAGPKGDVGQAAEILLTLAKEIPDSSYAPYAAHYAGCCYAAACITEAVDATRERRRNEGFKNDAEEGNFRSARMRENPDTAKAHEAFTIAALRADDYLKPHALYQHGFLRLFTYDIEEAEKLITQAAEAMPGEGTIQGWIAEARKGIEAAKSKYRIVDGQITEVKSP